jgi:beta-galactosidase
MPASTAEHESQTSLRRTYSLNRNWLFHRQDSPAGPSAGFDDQAAETVTLPHTVALLPWHSFDPEIFRCISHYRRRFRLPAALRSRRVFVDFAGVMTAAAVRLNGQILGEHRGGYLPFSYELTSAADWDNENVLDVDVDSTDRPDIPPFGGSVDYLAFGGIYREAGLRFVSDAFIENVLAEPLDVLSGRRRVRIRCWINDRSAASGASLRLSAGLEDEDRKLVHAGPTVTVPNPLPPSPVELVLDVPEPVALWDLDNPKLYTLTVRLFDRDSLWDAFSSRIGFREARFTPQGFLLNGRPVKLRGLNRHQTFPYVGGAMPERIQRRDAWILKRELKCNIVRTSHYPQATQFLDACDELGLMVLEEIPGWQHVGDTQWQDAEVRNVEEMICRDGNHPSIVLWGVRVNESADDHELYSRTNAAARALDGSRPTGGVRNNYESELLEDVFTMNDFGFPLRPPNHPLYLNTEFCGHMYPTKQQDSLERVLEQVRRHAQVLNQLAGDPRFAGGLGWCAFDYNTTSDFGSGDGICYHGVCDIFRIPKPAASFYRSQCDPREEVVLEPCFHWARGDANWQWIANWGAAGSSVSKAIIASNCDHLAVYLDGRLLLEADPDRETFGNLPYPPFTIDLELWRTGELRIEGYLGGRLAATKKLSAGSADEAWRVTADDVLLKGDGIDMTRVVLQVTDRYGGRRPFATGAVELAIEGPGEIIGENPFALTGGVGAIWVKTKPAAGVIRLHAKHPVLGTQTAEIRVEPEPAESL